MRVVHVHRLRGVGGSERHLLTLLPALRQRGIDARFVGLDDADPSPFYAQLDVLGVPYTRLSAPRDVDPLLAYRLRRAIRLFRPDIVHTHLVHADVYGAAVAGRAMLISTKHNDDPFRLGHFGHVERLCARRAHHIICITEALARFNIERVGIPAEKVSVVHYGLDDLPAAWGPPGGPLLPAGARMLLAISRLEQQKGLDVAIEALAQVRARFPDAVLVVLGLGSQRAELLALAATHGVADAVYLAGSVGDVTDWLRRAETFVHPARWEGFGLALLEAMLAGLPVIASAVSSIPEIVVDGSTGLLVPPDDAPALSAAISALLDDPGRARSLGAAGLERAHTHFSVAAMAGQTEHIYEEALASRRR
ncbi:MAG: glycosyltransferase family 4 protein [Thermoleophilia bacterium]